MIIKLLVLVVLSFITYKLFTGRKKDEVASKVEDAVELVQDPVSGTYIDKDTTFKVKYYEKVYYFATKENMDKFIADKKGEL